MGQATSASAQCSFNEEQQESSSSSWGLTTVGIQLNGALPPQQVSVCKRVDVRGRAPHCLLLAILKCSEFIIKKPSTLTKRKYLTTMAYNSIFFSQK